MENQNKNKLWNFVRYSKLSYKQKFFRSLLEIPIVLFALIFIWTHGSNSIMNMIYTSVLAIIVIGELTYTYLKWHKKTTKV